MDKIKRILKTKLCRGDLVHYVEIQERQLIDSGLESSQPVEEFIGIRYQWCALETLGMGVTIFNGINIVPGATHLFWCTWDSDFPKLENRNYFLSLVNENRRFKVLKVDNVNERHIALAIQTTERGNDNLEATEA